MVHLFCMEMSTKVIGKIKHSMYHILKYFRNWQTHKGATDIFFSTTLIYVLNKNKQDKRIEHFFCCLSVMLHYCESIFKTN